MVKVIASLLLIFTVLTCFSQSLLDELNADNSASDTVYAEATFKSTRLINGQSVETLSRGDLAVTISHRFGNLNSGISEFYGLDQSFIRLGVDYGITNRIDVGLGRSREQKLVDGYLKYKLFRQSSGAINRPVSVSVYSSMAIKTDILGLPENNYTTANRFNYIHEVIIARKFSERFSLQIVPGVVHRNMTDTKENPNVVYFAGAGGRLKITKRVAITSEYYAVLSNFVAKNSIDPFSVGFDIETGGHVFQLHFSNSRGMHEKIMIPENQNKWLKGDVGFGFNILRHFNFSK